MNDDSQEKRARRRYFRYAVLSLTALLVLSLGIALVPHEPPSPPEPPFSEQARASAFADAMSLRASVLELAGSAATADPASGQAASQVELDRVVTLLTFQARALMVPPAGSSSDAGAAGPGTASETPAASATPTASALPLPSPPELAAALSASGAKRLSDAETADGGMARLLAGTGTAQLLAAAEIASAAGVPAEALPSAQALPALPPSAALPPTVLPGSGGSEEATDGVPQAERTAGRDEETGLAADCGTAEPLAGRELASALTSAVEAELEAVYGYQAALTRLDSPSAAAASDLLEQHRDLVEEGAYYSRIHCATVPPQQPGYGLSQAFLDAPAAGLGQLEAGTLPVYGDIVALSQGATRKWAVSALVNAARRTLQWGADPGPVPGVPLNESQPPQLPE